MGLDATGRYWHSSDVKPEALWSYVPIMPYGTREAHVITNLLHEQLAKGLFLCCVPKRDTRLLSIAYRVARLLGCALKRTGLLNFKTYLDQRQSYIVFKTKTELLPS